MKMLPFCSKIHTITARRSVENNAGHDYAQELGDVPPDQLTIPTAEPQLKMIPFCSKIHTITARRSVENNAGHDYAQELGDHPDS
jgi:hypothetical protein